MGPGVNLQLGAPLRPFKAVHSLAYCPSEDRVRSGDCLLMWHFWSVRILLSCRTGCRFTWSSKAAPCSFRIAIIHMPQAVIHGGLRVSRPSRVSSRNMRISSFGMSLLTIWERARKTHVINHLTSYLDTYNMLLLFVLRYYRSVGLPDSEYTTGAIETRGSTKIGHRHDLLTLSKLFLELLFYRFIFNESQAYWGNSLSKLRLQYTP